MKTVILILALAMFAAPLSAQDVLFSAPGDSIVKLGEGVCPDQSTCLKLSNDADSRPNLSLVVPKWAAQGDTIITGADQIKRAYLKGMSDGYLVDYCNTCACCTTSKNLAGRLQFEPWENVHPELMLRGGGHGIVQQ